MSNQVGEIKRKGKSGSVGSFFFGWFIGFLLTIGLIGGLVAFAYFKVSINWVNNTFKQEINLGSEELNDLTINKLVSHVIELSKNIDSYTLNDLEQDFGISLGNSIVGIEISDLKTVPIPQLTAKIQNKLSNISAYELRNVLDLNDLNSILSKTNTYFVSGQLLYEDDALNTEVSFDYSIAEDKLTIKGVEFPIANEKVDVQLKYLPLTKAMSSFTTDLGNNITIGELRNDYGVVLPSYFDSVSDDTTINELGDAIDSLYIADFLGYTITGDAVYDSSKVEIKGVMATLAKIQVANLGSVKSEIDNMYIADILGYTYDKTSGTVTYQNGDVVTGVMAVVAKSTVSGLNTTINGLTIGDLFDDSQFNSGALKLIDKTTVINNIPTALSNALTSSTIDELIDANLISAPSNYTEENKVKYIQVGEDGSGSPIYKQVQNLLLEDIISVAFNNINFGLLPDTDPTT